ncbi:hypothetical protein Pelo_12134 [Pelomyxa schiedti]|nr:hypothetical protein Pelo_12134 [Pelomyxa schiedti]
MISPRWILIVLCTSFLIFLSVTLLARLSVSEPSEELTKVIEASDQEQRDKVAQIASQSSSRVASVESQQQGTSAALPPERVKIPVTVAFVATNGMYLNGILALVEGIRGFIQEAQLVLLWTPNVPPEFRDILAHFGFDLIQLRNAPTHRNWKPETNKWNDLLVKLELWNLDPIKYPRVLYFDADIVLLKDPMWIFDLPVPFAAQEDAHNCNLPKGTTVSRVCSGVMLLHPDRQVFSEMWNILEFSTTPVIKGDQELIERYWSAAIGPDKIVTLNESDVAFVHKCCGCFDREIWTGQTAIHLISGSSGWFDRAAFVGSEAAECDCQRGWFDVWQKLYVSALRKLQGRFSGLDISTQNYALTTLPGFGSQI